MNSDRRYGGSEDRSYGRDEEWGGSRARGRDEDDRGGGYFVGRDQDDDWRSRMIGSRDEDWRGRTYGGAQSSRLELDRDQDRSRGMYGRDLERDTSRWSEERGGYGRMGLGERGGWGSSQGIMNRDRQGYGYGGGGQGSYGGTQGSYGGLQGSYGGTRDIYGQGYHGGQAGYGTRSESTFGRDYGARGYGARDYGGRDYGARDYGARDYGARDYGARDYGGRGGREWISRDLHERSAYDRDQEEGGFFHRMGEGIKNAFGMGERERGPHFGKGPKGFKRSDDRIREEVSETIARQGWIDASDVEVKVQNGEVTLTGNIGDREHKRVLERMIEDLPGVDDVHNEIRVRRMMQGTTSTGVSGTQVEASESSRSTGRNARTS